MKTVKEVIIPETENARVIEVAKKYLAAFREVKPDLVKKHFLPQFIKMGYFFDYDNNDWTDISIHSFQQVLDWTKHYNANGIMPGSEAAITLLDIQDKTAVVKIIAEWAPERWGGDYILLSKQSDEWFIAAIFWQSII